MRRRLSTVVLLSGALASAGAGVGCGLDANGLEAAGTDGGPATTSAPVGDATVSGANEGGGPGSTAVEDGASVPVGSDDGAPVDSTTPVDSTAPIDSTAPVDSTSPNDAPPPPPPPPPPPTDAHVLDPDASYGDSGDPCDLDEDGYKSTADGCGGNDCCDYDGRANPGEKAFFSAPDVCGSFDYNCNGKNDPEYAKANCSLGFFSCAGSGFDQAPPACGVTATFDTCNNVVVACTTSQSQVAQGCN